MRTRVIISILFSIWSCNIFAGNITISGFVKDAVSKEPLIGANVYIENSDYGTITNNYGYFTLSIPEALIENNIVISFVGYQSFIGEAVREHTKIYLLSNGIGIDEVNVYYEKKPEETTDMSVMKIPLKEISLLPHLIQADIIKSIQLLPGVQGGNEGSAGIYVRGGSIDQNLVLLDDVPIYFINHAGNLVSVFDNNTLKDFKLYKGAFPARYGGRLSSVLDVKMKEGNKNEYQGEVGLGLISGNVFIEGPIKKDKSSFFFSYRRFWPEILINNLSGLFYQNFKLSYSFDDLSAKISTDISDKDKLILSFYKGKDNLTFKYLAKEKGDDFGYSGTFWNNLAGAAKYTHAFSKKIFSDFTVYYTKYQYKNEFEYNDYNDREEEAEIYFAEYLSNVQDLSAKMEIDFYPISKLSFKIGSQLIKHRYIPGLSRYNSSFGGIASDTINFEDIKAIEPSIFMESVFSINQNISFNIGLRNSYYLVDKTTNIHLEPRLQARLNIPEIFAVKASYAEMLQTIHLLTYSGAGFPSDLWLPATKDIAPAGSKQVATGIFKSINNGMYEVSIEGYYKILNNMIAYKEGVSFFSGTENWQEKVETGGTGISKGIEFFCHKKSGRITGWLSYTLAKTDRHFENKNNSQSFSFKYDRRYDISIAGNYKINDNMVASLNWVYGSGYPLTIAVTKYDAPDITKEYGDELQNIYSGSALIANYDGINAFRMRSVHRLDVALTYTKEKKNTERIWNFSIYNAYNRQNPYYYFYQYEKEIKAYKLYQQSLFPILPSVSYSIKF